MNSKKSWQVGGVPCKNNSFVILSGWKMFCQENSLKEGDICTFNVVEATLWHVVITHSNGKKMNKFCHEENHSFSRKLYSSKPKRKNNRSRNEGQQRPQGFMTSFSKVSPKTRNVFEIGPPAWIKKKINSSAIKNYLSLPQAFCDAIGLRGPCTITLKTSINSTMSWQVLVVPYKNGGHYVRGLDWKRFLEENNIKVDNVCTINIVETTLWHVAVECQ